MLISNWLSKILFLKELMNISFHICELLLEISLLLQFFLERCNLEIGLIELSFGVHEFDLILFVLHLEKFYLIFVLRFAAVVNFLKLLLFIFMMTYDFSGLSQCLAIFLKENFVQILI